MNQTPVQKGRYRHYKGKEYEVTGFAKHSETLEDMVIYETLYENNLSKVWVRPLHMFLETVTHDGKEIPWFQYIGE